MKDSFGRTISYLRVSVTDRCNLRCSYCMPAAGIKTIPHDEIMSYEEINEFVKVATGMGIRKVRLTGGEPLVRRNVVHLVEMLAGLEGLDELCLTTNGILLVKYAALSKRAGLDRINVSLDAVAPERYNRQTGGGQVEEVLAGIEAAQAAGFNNIKINCVVDKSREEPDAREVDRYAESRGFKVQFIPRMQLESGSYGAVDGGRGGKCSSCNRLRLSSDGYLRPCLLNDIKYHVRRRDYEEVIREALGNKPKRGTASKHNQMYFIGG